MTLTREDVQSRFDVSRETMQRLDVLVALLQKWTPKINLVSRDSLAEVWHRHIADSAQLWEIAGKRSGNWLDLGSGAGFPGLVLAAMGADTKGFQITLVESDARKAAFLSTVIREAALPATVKAERIEHLPPQDAAVLTARALAPLKALLEMTERHRSCDGIALFPKGRTVHKEIEDVSPAWRFTRTLHPSVTDPEARIVEIGALTRA